MVEEQPLAKLIESYAVKSENSWIDEEVKKIKTINNSVLKIARIVFKDSDPQKRCLAFSKNRKSLAFDLEMVPLVIVMMANLTPETAVPEEFRPLLKKIKALIK